jgi:two-component system phosphate regulon sensor histidine kinase PhoR
VKLGIRSKLFLLSFGLVASVLLAADLLLTRTLDGFLSDRIRTDLLTRAVMAERQTSLLPGLTEPGPKAAWEGLAQELGRSAQARLTIIASDGRVLGDSEVAAADIGRLENHRDRPEVAAALAGRQGASVRYSATLGQRMMYAAVPLRHEGTVLGVVRLALSLSEVDKAVSQLHRILFGASLAALAFAALLTSLAVQWASRPLRRLTELSSRMVDGELRERSHNPGSDEVATLGQSLDRLAANLASTLEQLRTDHALLEAIFDGMQEGVMVVARDGRILHANPALRGMFLLGTEAIGRPMLEVIRNAHLKELLDRAHGQPEGARGEIEVSGIKPRKLQVQVSQLVGQPGDSLVVLVDVTQLRYLESVRRDFVANASHELRTPVASILSSAETLRAASEDAEARQTFLGIIERNAARLRRLVEDLLDLSRIEAREYRLDPQPMDLQGFVTGMVEAFASQAAARSIRIEADPALAGLTAVADRRALEQVLVNLLDNALKYGSPGSRVRITARVEDGKIRLDVTDEGPGIDPQHLPRLFERFYRVDAGRSRELGGTGLGLAIVKNLMEAMGGAVSVESATGAGSTFSLTLPTEAAEGTYSP